MQRKHNTGNLEKELGEDQESVPLQANARWISEKTEGEKSLGKKVGSTRATAASVPAVEQFSS